MLAFSLFQGGQEHLCKNLAQLRDRESMLSNCLQICSDLKVMTEDGRKVLNDSEALVPSYQAMLDVLTVHIEKAENLLSRFSLQSQNSVVRQLQEFCDDAKNVRTEAVRRIELWDQFVSECNLSWKQLDDVRRPLEKIEKHGLRNFDKMLEDLENLKVLFLRCSFLTNLPSQLLSLSSQLYPVTKVYREAKAVKENVEEIEKRIENLLDSMSAEFRVREEIVRSLLVISDELISTDNLLTHGSISPCKHEEMQLQLDAIRAHLTMLDEDIDKYNSNRIYLNGEEDISTKHNFERLSEVEETLKRVKFDDRVEEGHLINEAVEVLTVERPDEHPGNVSNMQTIGDEYDLYDLSSSSIASEDDESSNFQTPPNEVRFLVNERESETNAPSANLGLSPVPEDPNPRQYERQRIRWRRILRTALPLQV
ncbi:unnamed protein product [Thelazia callipaeda]|uniref:KASH domain-containing protein n=1 Tax=Thelazia callipaeda TaxID=103827 RepID=A0A0N5CST0_THECL|nr:unnamed protein product [Thelazia callipaeda]